MKDIVDRLRDEGKDAFAEHYSLGMFRLCAEAADEIERLRRILEPFAKAGEMAEKIGFAHACASYVKAEYLRNAKDALIDTPHGR